MLEGVCVVMYTSYFGLKEAPFTITPDPRYVYMSERHREALAHLLYGVGEGGGFVQLTGEVGTGKTTLCRCLLEQLPPHVDVALILNPRLTSLELLASVCDELRISYPAGTTSVKVLVDALYRYLLDAHARGRRTVLIVDEAQDLSAEVLEQIRLLTNLETTREKLLQIILIGQPELIQLLDREDLRQLAQRVTARCHLEPFSEEETCAYIRHRLEVAGGTHVIVSDAAMRKVHAESRGIPRLINVICDRAMLGAYAHQKARVDALTVVRAAAEVRGRVRKPWYAPSWRWAIAAAVLGVAAVGGAVVLSPEQFAHRSRSVPSSAPSPAAPAPVRPVTAVADKPTASPNLAQLLSDPALRSDKASAFAALYSRWGLDHAVLRGELGCEGGRAEGLRCLFRAGTWDKLRGYTLPAILALAAPTGSQRYATVTGLGEQTVILEIGGRQFTFLFSEVDPLWDGSFILLWKAPPRNTVPIAPGVRGPDVEWLRRRLAGLDGGPVMAKNRQVYDGDLKDRVIRFQRRRSLVPDGIVGRETLTHLTTALREPGVPLLSSPDE